MAFHNKATDGNMKQASIISIILNDDIAHGMEEHDNKVSAFNSVHNVFFNQIVPTIRLDNTRVMVTTVCLYADGK